MSKWKYADVEFANEYDEGKSTVVTADIPPFLEEKLEVGDSVVIEHHGKFKCAKVRSVDLIRRHNVRATCVSKFKLGRYVAWKDAAEKAKVAQIAMGKRLEKLERDAQWREAAEADPVMAELYECYGEAAKALAD